MIRSFMILLLAAICAIATDTTASKTTISVFGLKAIGAPQELAVSLQENVESNLIKYGRFDVMSRNDMDMILRENRFQQSGACIDEECVLQAGHILGVQKMVTGTVSRLGQTYNVVLKMIDVSSARLVSAVSRKHSGTVDNLLAITDEMVLELLGQAEAEISGAGKSDSSSVSDMHPDTLDVKTIGKEAEEPTGLAVYGKESAEDSREPSPKAKWIGIGALVLLGSIAAIVLISNVAD